MALSREELEAKAESLNINFNSRWGDETLIKKIEEAEAELSKEEAEPEQEEQEVEAELPKSYKTTYAGAFYIGTIEFLPGVAVQLNAEQQALKKTIHAINTGLLVKA